MKLARYNETLPEMPTGKRCIINISMSSEGDATVHSLELHAPRGRNRTTFMGKRGLDDVFITSIALFLRDSLGKLSRAACVLAVPDQIIEAKGLVLSGMHMMSKYAEDGSASVIIRFKRMIGDVSNALHEIAGFGTPAANLRDEVSLSVLADISLPLLDICACTDQKGKAAYQDDTSYFKHIAEHAGEIRFHVELIKRYIAGLDRSEMLSEVHSPLDHFDQLRLPRTI